VGTSSEEWQRQGGAEVRRRSGGAWRRHDQVNLGGGDNWDKGMVETSSIGGRVEMHLLLENETLQ
jgi:hypothetical protein